MKVSGYKSDANKIENANEEQKSLLGLTTIRTGEGKMAENALGKFEVSSPKLRKRKHDKRTFIFLYPFLSQIPLLWLLLHWLNQTYRALERTGEPPPNSPTASSLFRDIKCRGERVMCGAWSFRNHLSGLDKTESGTAMRERARRGQTADFLDISFCRLT